MDICKFVEDGLDDLGRRSDLFVKPTVSRSLCGHYHTGLVHCEKIWIDLALGKLNRSTVEATTELLVHVNCIGES